MTVRNTKGLTIQMSKGTVPSTLTVTAVTAAKPAEVSLASTTDLADGQLVIMTGTGLASIDGKEFVISALQDDASFELLGSDSSAESGDASAGTATFYADSTDMETLCLSTIGINAETASPVSVGTFCDPTATVSGLPAGAGTVDLGFFLDKDSAGYHELLKAEADGNERIFKIMFPDNGYMIMKGTVGSVTITDMPLDGAVALSANITLSTKAIHLF